jgi:hypothetical protein
VANIILHCILICPGILVSILLLVFLFSCVQVVRSFKPPAGVAPGEVDAAGDGEVLVVLDLAQQDDLVEQGLARELVNRWVLLSLSATCFFLSVTLFWGFGGAGPGAAERLDGEGTIGILNLALLATAFAVCRYQKLRKKAGLTVTDVVELYYAPAAAAAAADGAAAAAAEGGIPALLTKIIEGQAGYLTEAFGKPLQALVAKPDSSVVIAQELQTIGGDENGASFVAVLAAAPGSCVVVAAAAAGSVQHMSLQ